ncbi:hypothetical protein H0H92_001902 [Tricholoma furcatifolium]|nr:hypothetical protein H0H92_001902 [Tricholoma furcatifolium]
MLPAFAKLAAIAALAPFVLSVPTNELTKRQSIDTTTHCGQWDTVVAGQYTLYLDQWGESGATSGSDCATLTSLSGTTIAWNTNWTWTGGTGVKSFTNIALDDGLNVQLSTLKSIPTTWDWSQANTGTVVADVAYDIFTSATSGGSNAYEIMIWLANYNAGPISYNYDSSGNPEPVATGISLGGQTWDLYYGDNGSNYVYSFLPATSGTTVTSFSADINEFLQYLVTNESLSSAQYLTTLQAGTEATSGTATLTT